MLFRTLAPTRGWALAVLTCWGILAAWSAPAVPGATAQPVTLDTLLAEMVDREAVARWPDPPYTCGQASSWDRRSKAPGQPGWFANLDTGMYLRIETNGGQHLWWRDARPGEKLDLVLPVAKPGRYELRLHLRRARDYGRFQFWLDGAKLGEPVDLDHREVDTVLINLGTRDLLAGDHVLSAEVVGANPAAEPRHMLGLDYVELRPVNPPSAAKQPCAPHLI